LQQKLYHLVAYSVYNYTWEVNIIMKNKFIKTLSLGIVGFMLSLVILQAIPQSNLVSSASNPRIFETQDPPSH
jgi:hypothetical protein